MEEKKNRTGEILRFALTGGICFLAELAVLVLLKDGLGLDTLIATPVAFLVSVILNYLMENSTFTQEIPWEFTDRMEAAYKKMYREYAGLYGEDLPTFMARIGSTQETYEEDIKKIAEQYSRQVLILQAIGEKENLLPTEKEMQDYAEKTAASFGYESAQAYEKDFPIELVYDNLICDKVLTYLRGNVKPVSEEEPAGQEEPAGGESAPEGAQ